MHIELYRTEDNQIRVVLQGEGYGELHFRDFSAFLVFIKKCHDFVEQYEAFAKAYANLVTIETPIPEPFLDIFSDGESPN